MAIIDLVRWQPQGGPTIYAYRFPETNLSTYTQLLVSESQEAVLFSKGQLMASSGPANTHSTQRICLFSADFSGCRSAARILSRPKYGMSTKSRCSTLTGA